MPKTPRSHIRRKRPVINYENGLIVGGRKLDPDDLAGLAGISDIVEAVDALEESVDTAGTGLLARADALETSVDAETTGLLARADALETRASGLEAIGANIVAVPTDGAKPFAFVDTSEPYTYDDEPADPDPDPAHLIDMPSDATEAAITPAGATAYALTFSLPPTKTVPVFKVVYTAGTHTGDVKIDGLVGAEVTIVDGTHYFIWDDGAEGWVESDDDAVIQLSGDINLVTVPQALQPGAGKTLTVLLPTTQGDDFIYVEYDTSSAASGDTVIGGVTVDDGTGAAGVLPFWWNADLEVYVSLTSADPKYTIPDNCPFFSLEIEDGNSDNTYKVALPTGVSNARNSIVIQVELTAGANHALLDIAGALTGEETSVTDGGKVYQCVAAGIWFPYHALFAGA